MSKSIQKCIEKKINENIDQYNEARRLVLSNKLSVSSVALKLGLITSYLQYYVRQSDPDNISKNRGYSLTHSASNHEFINKKYPVETEADRVQAERVVVKYRNEGLMFIEDGKSIACFHCQAYVCWSTEYKVKRHVETGKHRANKSGM
jgi:hypothetical protein